MMSRIAKIFLLFLNKISKPCRRNRLLSLNIFIFLIIIVILNRSFNKLSSLDLYKLQKNDFYLDFDFSVNTTDYLVNYYKYSALKNEIKQNLDEDNTPFKTVIQNERNPNSLKKSEYIILEFTKVFDQEKFCNFKSQKDIYLNECPYKNCKFTCDRKLAKSADSLLFHAADLPKESIETSVYLKKFLSHTSERKDQVWVLWHDEPTQLPNSFDKYKINWTLSYLLDSEISDCSYGCTYANQISDETLSKNFYKNIKEEFLRRKRSGLWFVSNCGASFRNKFAIELNELYPIKVFGICGDQFRKKYKSRVGYLLTTIPKLIINYFTLNFFKTENDFKNYDCGRNTNCEFDEFNQNMFYLSFESKNCSNYITEKLWRILNTRLIPIVIQPSKYFYEQIAPKNSFIHAQDFNYDVEKLASYLKLVSKNFDLYLNHQSWRLNYEVVHSTEQTEKRRFCELCTKLNTETSSIYYEKISEWFSKKCYKS